MTTHNAQPLTTGSKIDGQEVHPGTAIMYLHIVLIWDQICRMSHDTETRENITQLVPKSHRD